jgi:hypothetical protein
MLEARVGEGESLQTVHARDADAAKVAEGFDRIGESQRQAMPAAHDFRLLFGPGFPVKYRENTGARVEGRWHNPKYGHANRQDSLFGACSCRTGVDSAALSAWLAWAGASCETKR